MDGSGSLRATADETGRISSDLRFPADAPGENALQQRSIIWGRDVPPAMLQAERGRLVLLDTPLFVPLPGKERLIGWMALGPRWSGEPYSEQALAFLESLGDQAALALERAQVLANLEHHLREMDVLARVAEGINVTLAFDDLLEMFYAQTNQLIPTRDFRIMLKKDLGQDFHYVFYLENDERIPSLEGQSLIAGQALDIEVVRSRRAIVTEDYASECRSRSMTVEGEGINAWMGVPLRAGADTIGVVSLGSRDQNVVYTAQQVNLLQAIADLAAGAIIKARLLEESEIRARQLAILNDLTRRLTSTLELEPLLNQILHSAVEILACEAGSLLLVDEETGESVFEVVTGPVAEDLLGRRLPPGAGLAGKAVKTGQPIIQNDVSRSADWYNTDQQTGYSTRDMLVVPMLIQERVIGVLEVLTAERMPFAWDDLETLSLPGRLQ
jgi:GAF domain-containing protein